MKYYISDLHFFHEKLNIEMDNRGFGSVEEMHDYIIKRWNRRVNRRDEVFILGDLSFGKVEETNAVLKKLNGKLSLIIGNHDYKLVNKIDFDKSRFEWIKEYKEISDNGKKIILCHYPVMCYNGQYRRTKTGEPKTYMIYGHVHDTHDQRLIEKFVKITREYSVINKDGSRKDIPCNMLNCFCMYSDYEPWSLNEWISYWKERGMVE